MTKKLILLLIPLSVMTIAAGHAGEVLVVTYGNIADRIRRQNPELMAARHLVDEALGRLNQSGRLTNPDLEIGIDHDSRLREGSLGVGVAQRFPVTARLAMEKCVRMVEWQAAQAEVREVERQLVAEARAQLIRLLAGRERRALLGRQLDVCGHQADWLAAAADRGEMPMTGAGLARIEAASIRLQLGQWVAREVAVAADLKRLLGMTPDDAVELSGTLPEPVSVAVAVDPGRRPDHEVARLAAEAASAQVALEQARRYDDVEAGVFLSAERREDAPEGYQDEAMIGMKLSIPLPLHNDNRGSIAEAEARAQRKQQELAAKTQAIVLEADAEQAAMQRWQQVIRNVDDELLPLADEQLKLAEEALRNGQGDVETLMRVSDTRFELLLSKLDALEEFHLARVRHEAATSHQ